MGAENGLNAAVGDAFYGFFGIDDGGTSSYDVDECFACSKVAGFGLTVSVKVFHCVVVYFYFAILHFGPCVGVLLEIS